MPKPSIPPTPASSLPQGPKSSRAASGGRIRPKGPVGRNDARRRDTFVATEVHTPDVVPLLITLRTDLQTLEGKHHVQVREKLAEVYRAAVILRADEEQWLSFARHPEWEGFAGRPKEVHRSDALRYAIRFAVGIGGDPATKRATTKKASKYFGALRAFFDDEVPANEVADRIEEAGGIEALSRSAGVARTDGLPAEYAGHIIICLPKEVPSQRVKKTVPGKKMKLTLKIRRVAGDVVEADCVRSALIKSKK